jgi:GT2 family glycosyltransferase
VSVIVPVHDGAATLGACLDALCGLDYPRHELEIIVVDNRSKDATRAIAARHPVHLVHESGVQSSYAARNRGVLAASGEGLRVHRRRLRAGARLRALVAPFAAAEVTRRRGRDRSLCRGQHRRALSGAPCDPPSRPSRASGPVRAQTANAAYPRDLVLALGGFDARIPFGGDLDFSWRLQRRTGRRLVFAPDALVRHRHRTTWRGLAALYEKNAIANCLLAERHAYYGRYPEVRTFAYCARECLRSLLRGALRMPGGGSEPNEHFAEAVRFAGEMRGWLRWHAGRVRIPDVAGSYPLADDATSRRPAPSSAETAPREALARP